MKISKLYYILFVLFLSLTQTSCSHHYRDAVQLEEQKRWEEAAIEYRLAHVQSPNDEDIKGGLQRMNLKVADENLVRYREYLQKKDFKKAYKRLEAASLQNPQLTEVQNEFPKWRFILLAGKVEFIFDRFQSNIRLADDMQLQIHFNTPAGDLLTADISNESGLFFVEELVYHQELTQAPLYTINSIGLKIIRLDSENLTKKDFKKFIQFRNLAQSGIQGQLNLNPTAAPQAIIMNRSELLSQRKHAETFWSPANSVLYSTTIEDKRIVVYNSDGRLDFLPDVYYINQEQKRSFLDYGLIQLQMNNEANKWTIRKPNYDAQNKDYFAELSKNLALSPYFLYKEAALPFVLSTK